MSVEVGATLSLEVSKIVHGGLGLARHEGFVVFVPGTLPGETVTARITETKKSHATAELLAVVEESPHRQPHIWPEADVSRPPELRPGGADFGHIALTHQRELKAEVIREALRRQGQVEESLAEQVVVQTLPGHPEGLHWRTRVTLHVGEDGRCGPRAYHSHRVIPVATLPLAKEELVESGVMAEDWGGASRVSLVASSTGQVVVKTDRDDPVPVTEQVGDAEFQLDSASFWQVHHDAPATLVDAVWRAIDGDIWDGEADNLDLYGGVGLFARMLLDKTSPADRMTSVEADAGASHFARMNLARFPGAEVIESDTLRFLRTRATRDAAIDRDRLQRATVIVDPPRSGLGGEAVGALVDLRPAQLVYVACDPVAFARDQKSLAHAGYELRTLEAFDAFPHTHHVECVAGFVRREG